MGWTLRSDLGSRAKAIPPPPPGLCLKPREGGATYKTGGTLTLEAGYVPSSQARMIFTPGGPVCEQEPAKQSSAKRPTAKKSTAKASAAKKAAAKKSTTKTPAAASGKTTMPAKQRTPAGGTAPAKKAPRAGSAATSRLIGLRGKAGDAARSRHFGQAKSRAKQFVDDPEKLSGLLDEAISKSGQKKLGRVREIIGEVQVLMRLVRAYAQGNYREISRSDLVLVVAALIYFVSPLDLIPDALGPLGLSDDAVVLSFVISFVKTELDDFRQWEESRSAGSSS